MLLSHTPTGALAPDLIFCAFLPAGQRHQRATRPGVSACCPQPCASTCRLQTGCCRTPSPQPARLLLALHLSATLTQLVAAEPPLAGLLISRN